MPSTEWKRRRTGENGTRARPSGRDRAGPGHGDAAVAGGHDLDIASGQRFAPHLIRAIDDGAGWKRVEPQPPLATLQTHPRNLNAIRRGPWMVVDSAGTGGRAASPANVAGKTGMAQVISLTGGRRQGPDQSRPPRSRLVPLLRAADSPILPASCSPSTPSTGIPARSPSPRWRVLRQEGRTPLAGVQRVQPPLPPQYHADAAARRRPGGTPDVRARLFYRLTGSCLAPSRCCAHRPGDDPQHHLRRHRGRGRPAIQRQLIALRSGSPPWRSACWSTTVPSPSAPIS